MKYSAQDTWQEWTYCNVPLSPCFGRISLAWGCSGFEEGLAQAKAASGFVLFSQLLWEELGATEMGGICCVHVKPAWGLPDGSPGKNRICGLFDGIWMPGGLHKPQQAASDSLHCQPLGTCLGEESELPQGLRQAE